MCELGISLSVPRACLRAQRFANLPGISFVTINTNELTQMVFGVEQRAANRIMVNSILHNYAIPEDLKSPF